MFIRSFCTPRLCLCLCFFAVLVHRGCVCVCVSKQFLYTEAVSVSLGSSCTLRLCVCLCFLGSLNRLRKCIHNYKCQYNFPSHFFGSRLARRGRTIVFSLHQPRFSIYKMFDTLLLLSQGHTVYFGPARDALHFFSMQGERRYKK